MPKIPTATYVDSNRIRFHQDLHLRRRQIDHYRFLQINSGRGEFRFPDCKLSVHGGMLLLLSPGIRESLYNSEEEVSYVYVEFDTDSKLIADPFLQCSPSSAHFKTLCGLIGSVHRERGQGVDRLLPAAIELALLQSSEAAGDDGIDPRILKVLQHIDQNIDRPMRVADLATEAGLSVPHFRRLFHKAMNTGPKDFLLRERMHHARRILQTEGLRVGEVADVLHFDNVFQFSNQYKRVFGHSPLQDRGDAGK